MATSCPFCGTPAPDARTRICPKCQTPLPVSAPTATAAGSPTVATATFAAMGIAIFAGGIGWYFGSAGRAQRPPSPPVVVAAGSQPTVAEESCGSAVACRKRGIDLEAKGPSQDVPRAVRLYEKACVGGDGIGCQYAGDMYMDGKGVGLDKTRATEFYMKGCDAGTVRACDYACTNYKKGNGVAIDLPRAFALCKRACDAKDPFGCNDLALFYRDGLTVPVDKARAEALLLSACGDDDGLACHNLAGMVRARDAKRAAALEQEACEKKNQAGCDAVKKAQP
jgi:hypothetical protein